MSEWPIRKIGQAGVSLIDCVHATPKSIETGYPYVAIPQMKSGHLDFEEARKISEVDFVNWTKKARPRMHDVILSRRTNPGVIAVDRTGRDFALGQNLVLLRADGCEVLPEFLRWLASGPEWWSQVNKFMNVGAVFNSLKCADVPNFELTIPPKSIQKHISDFLDALDDKIELNRRMNETLEAMAQAIFKDWFVDFGPTRRKLTGEIDPVAILGSLVPDPEQAAPIADLLPAAFGNNGLPEGWEEKPIGDLADIVGGSTPSTKEPDFWEGGTNPWATPRDLSKLDGLVLFETERQVTDAGLAKITSGLSPVGTVLLSSRAPIGYLAIAATEVAVNQGFIALRPTERMPTVFALLWCRENMDIIKANANGSTFQEISKKNFRPLPVVSPTGEIRSAFCDIAQPLIDQIELNLRNSKTLAQTRDLLLPKLMSGEIRVVDAEAMATEVAV